MDQSIWIDKLKEKGLKATQQRLAILEVLVEENFPLSAQNIFSKLRRNNPNLRLSTVYRTLNSFVEKKIVRKLDLIDKESFFELLSGEHHHHLICMKCGEIIPIDCPLKDYEEELIDNTDYTIIDHRLKIYGICPRCR
ncbi:MAG: hypothetical protein PWR10_1614 [Halanaerobiales bacterium]|nr:hypothetical protein [Halanaerobiales bacterium]